MAWSFNVFTGNLDQTGSSGAVVFEGEVETFDDLPAGIGDPAVGASFLVRSSTGVWLVNRRQAGIWIRRNNTGVRATDWEYGGDYPVNSVNGQTGNVSLTASDVGLGNVTNAAQVTSVTGTAPIVSSGGTTPAISISAATTSAAGSMSAADKTKLDGIAAGAEANVQSNWTEADTGSDAFILNKPSTFAPSSHSSSHASAGSDPLFDQDLNTTDSVDFNTVTLNNLIVPNGLSGIDTPLNGLVRIVDESTTGSPAADFVASNNLTANRTYDLPDRSGELMIVGDAPTSHTHGSLTNDGKIGTTAGLPVVTTTAGAVTTLALGTAGQVLTVNSGATGVEFAAASGGVSAVNSTLADILSVSGSDLVADDLGADKLYGWDDSASKAIGFTIGSGLSVSGDTLSATATGTIGGSTGSTDNSLLRSDGTGGSTAQASALVVDDAVVTFTGITGDAGTDIITATGSAFSNGQRVRFTALTGGSGLNTTTNYFVINASGATFQVSTSQGGAASLFTTNITNGTLLTGHSVQAHVALNNNSSDTNSALVIAPKGTGALIAQIPDATTTGGNARGANAVDLQTARITATAVASGQYAAIAGGQRNTASAISSSVGGGEINTASNSYSRVGGGKGNTASGSGSIVGGGENNSATGDYSTVGGGYINSATGIASVVAGGGWWNPTYGNTASATNSAVLGGWGSLADRYGMQAHQNGRFAANGDAQRARFVLRCKTTTNSAVEMALDGSTTYLTIPSGKVIFCNIKVVGVKSDGSVVATYERQYAAKNVAGTSSEVYAAVTIGTDNASSTSLEVATVDAGDYIRIRPTGIASETWRWVASVDAVEVAYGT